MVKIVDTNRDVTHRITALRAAGVTSVFRYFNRTNPAGEKTVKQAEARALAAAGLRLGIVHEGRGDRPDVFDQSIGHLDGLWCRDYMAAVGATPNAAIYFAVDFDATERQVHDRVLPYFAGVASALHGSPYRVGAYGSGAVCEAAIDHDLATLTWLSCSMGWRDSRKFLASYRWNMLQHLPRPVAGVDADTDEPNSHARSPTLLDVGDFLPFARGPTPLAVPEGAVGASGRVMRGITATEFGGASDPQDSAYGGKVHGDRLEVALPARLPPGQRRVRVTANGVTVECRVTDVGPWNVHDPYWETKEGRPAAEAEHDEKREAQNGRVPTNRAGIDLTPAVFDALGAEGRGVMEIDWEFVA